MKKRLLLLVCICGMVWVGIAPAAEASPILGVHTPKPTYPLEALNANVTGSGMCHVHFDASGHVNEAVMTKSTGSPILDENTLNFARKNWTGPPDRRVFVPINYVLTKSPKINGASTCRVSFDAAGHATSVVIIKSLGSKILDDATVSFALKNWTGAPNTTVLVPIMYKLR